MIILLLAVLPCMAQYGCPTVKTTIFEHQDKITKMEIKVKQIHKTCTRRREIIDLTTSLVGRVRGHLLQLRQHLYNSKVAARGEQAYAFDKWMSVIDSLISQFTKMSPNSDLGIGEVETCITTVTEITQRITRLRHELRELEVIQSCDRVSVRLREVVNEYQRIETDVRRFITATESRVPSRGRMFIFNTGGGNVWLANLAQMNNHNSTVSGSSMSFFPTESKS